MNPKPYSYFNPASMSYEQRFSYAMGHRNFLQNVVREFLVEEKGNPELYLELVEKYTSYMISQECFGIKTNGGDAFK